MTGVLAWSNQDLKFLFAHDDRVYAVTDHFDKRIFFSLDMTTGNIVSEVESKYLNTLQEALPEVVIRSWNIRKCSMIPMLNGSSSKSAISSVERPEFRSTGDLVKKNCLIVSYYENLDRAGSEPKFQHIFL